MLNLRFDAQVPTSAPAPAVPARAVAPAQPAAPRTESEHPNAADMLEDAAIIGVRASAGFVLNIDTELAGVLSV